MILGLFEIIASKAWFAANGLVPGEHRNAGMPHMPRVERYLNWPIIALACLVVA